jgi:hypothetical protein
MTKLDFLIQSISNLDIDSIDLLLDDHRTYQDQPKQHYLDLIIQCDGEHVMDNFSCALLKLDHEMELGDYVSIKPDLKLSDLDIDR